LPKRSSRLPKFDLHYLPQQAPKVFADAVVELMR
jgi:hypothetical protein